MIDLLMNRRTIRKYTDEEVNKEIIDKIIKAALTSPTGRNKKPCHIVVVEDKEVLSNLGNARGIISAHMKSAGLGIVIVADPEITDTWIEDASIMATIIQLTAGSLDLGSCWIQARERFNDEDGSVEDSIKEILNIPENYRVECMIAIGYPDEEKNPHDEEELGYEKVHYDRFLDSAID